MTKRKRDIGAELIEAAEEMLAFAKGEPSSARIVWPINPSDPPQPSAADRADRALRHRRPGK